MFDKRYQVFVSSTLRDLEEERRLVFRQLQKMNAIPAGMEIFTAMDEQQLEYIKRVINRSDYYVLIIGARYGSPTPDGISYTEAEFNYAVEMGIPVLAFIHSKPEDIPQKHSEKEPNLARRLEAFRETARTGRLVEHWEHKHELPALVGASLSVAISLYPRAGWVRGNQVASAEILAELHELRKQKEKLEARLLEAISREPSEDPAAWDRPFSLKGTVHNLGKQSTWTGESTVRNMFAKLSRYMLRPVEESLLRHQIQPFFLGTRPGPSAHLELNSNAFRTAMFRLRALGLVDVDNGGEEVRWFLTKKGIDALMNNLVGGRSDFPDVPPTPGADRFTTPNATDS
jgi:hypothetical protein